MPNYMGMPRPNPRVAGQSKGMTKPYDEMKAGRIEGVAATSDQAGAVPKDLSTGSIPAFRRLQARKRAAMGEAGGLGYNADMGYGKGQFSYGR